MKVFGFQSPLIRSSDQSFDQGRHQMSPIELVIVLALCLVGDFTLELFFVNGVMGVRPTL